MNPYRTSQKFAGRAWVWALFMVCFFNLPSYALAGETRGFFMLNLDGGGEKLATLYFAGGGSASLTAGGKTSLGGGISMLNDSKDFETQVAISWKNNSISASNQSLEFTRYPLDILFFYRGSDFRFGGGLTYHLSPVFSASGSLANGKTTFHDSPGLLLEGDFITSDGTSGLLLVGLRIFALNYTKAGSPSINGSGAGLGITYMF